MYINTVVQQNELQMNLKPVIEFTESLKQHCTTDETAAKLLSLHTTALNSIVSEVKTPEQIERNCRNLDRIKASLSQAQQQRQAMQQAQRRNIRHFRFGVPA